MKDIRELNDNELKNIYGGQSTNADCQSNWFDNENVFSSDACMFGAPAIIR